MLTFRKKRILSPNPNCPWAEKMVLNPAITPDPENPDTLYMLFRSTGEWRQAVLPGKPAPYPIFLGFGVSHDAGRSWTFDFSRPAMQPGLIYDEDIFRDRYFRNETMFNYSNGCIEDPRLFRFEKELYLCAACRAFPPGPYWDHDDPVQCMPEWAKDKTKYGPAITENRTVSLLFKVDLKALASGLYDEAFRFVCPLHQPDISDDRDVVLFPRRLMIDGIPKIVCLHRPKEPWNYEIGKNLKAPSIFMACADRLEDFFSGVASEFVFAVPEFPWEENRIGASSAPLEVSPGLWLIPYHGKQNDTVGYTQSFMLLREQEKGLPLIEKRPAGRLLYADQPWELEGDFTIPCLFTCSGVLKRDGTLLMGYGAADRVVGIAECEFGALLHYLQNR